MNARAVAVAQRPDWLARRGLWAHRDFLRLWSAQSVSLFGSEITVIALPLTAVLVLGASPAQMGLLAAAGQAPLLLFGLLAGVWVDRLRCRTVMVIADSGRAVLLGSIPLAAVLGVLRIEHLFVVAFLAGVLTVFFDVAYLSYLPELVERDELHDANGKLESTKSIADMGGPTLGSILLQVTTAPLVIGLDALSFVISALSLHSIRTSNSPVPHGRHASMRAEIGRGVRLVLRHPLLRPIAACSATMNLFYQMLMAVYILYVTTGLHVPPGLVGAIVGIGSVGGLGGALVASRCAQRFGTGRTLIVSTVISSLGGLCVAVQPGVGVGAIAPLVGAQLLLMLGVPIYNINQVSLRQAITPAGVRGRVNATNRFAVWGTMPLGSLLGGVCGQALGLQPTIAVAATGMLLAALWILLSPVRSLDARTIRELSTLT